MVVLTIGYGRPPWIALTLAFSFATYGLLKKKVGPTSAGSTVSPPRRRSCSRPRWLLLWLEVSGRGTFAPRAPGHALLLAATGVVTAVPLLLFGAGARRVPLSTMGLLQYIAPVFQFLRGILYFDEAMPPGRWAGFGMVWLALSC